MIHEYTSPEDRERHMTDLVFSEELTSATSVAPGRYVRVEKGTLSGYLVTDSAETQAVGYWPTWQQAQAAAEGYCRAVRNAAKVSR